jgi:CRP-like cAMP-binding protein
MTDIAKALASTPLFHGVSKKDLGKLGKDVHDRTVPAGTVLTDEGEFGSIFTIIADGQATVTVRDVAVRSLGPGDFFGEMALIDTNVRSAKVTADTEVRGLMVTQPVFRSFTKTHPETMWKLLEMMVQRVREAEGRLAE